MEPATWLIVISLLFGGYEYSRADKLEKRVEALESERAKLVEVANENSQEAARAAEVANENRNIAHDINARLGDCVEELRSFSDTKAIFEAANERSSQVIAELEARVNQSDLNECSVPGWLVDEIAGDSL